MSFLETPRFPDNISYGSSGGPEYNTSITEVFSGYEARNQNWQYPKHLFNVAYGVKTQASLDALIEFFHAVAGRAHGFRYKDWADYKSCISTGTITYLDQAVGTGDGQASQVVQLKKTYVKGALSSIRNITKPIGATLLVGVNGTLRTTGLSLDTVTGLLTLTPAAANGHAITAGFEFDVPVRFDNDYLSVNLQAFLMGAADVTVREIRV